MIVTNRMRTFALPVLFIITLAFKLLVISGNEAVSEGSDSVEYLLLARAWFWGFVNQPIRGPAYPLFVAALHYFNLPLRISSEIFFAAGAAWFCQGLVTMRVHKVAVYAVFLALLFHPLVFLNLDMPMSEGLFVTLTLFSLGALIRILMCPALGKRLVNSFVFGLASVLMIHTRDSDKSLILLLLAATFFCVAVQEILKSRTSWIWKSLAICIAGVAPIAVVNLAVFTANYVSFGRFGPNSIANDRQLNLVHTLMTIDTHEVPKHPRILVSTKAREIAYDLSPTLRPYRDKFENVLLKSKSDGAFGTFERTGIRGELDTEDTFGLIARLCDNALKQTAAEQELAAKMCGERLDQIAQEIKDSAKKKGVPTRTIFFIFNPSLDLMVPVIRKSLKALVASFFAYADEPIQDYYPFYGTLFSELYDTMAGRNPKLLKKGPLEGFVSVPEGEKIASITFANDSVEYLKRVTGDPQPFAFPFKLMKDQDLNIYIDLGKANLISPADDSSVPATLKASASNRVADVFKFTIPAVKDRVYLHFTRFTITLASGGQFVIRDIDLGSVRADPSNSVRMVATKFDVQLSHLQRQGYKFQRDLFRAFNKYSVLALAALVGLATISAATYLVRRRTRKLVALGFGMPAVICALIFSSICARLVFYVLVDATVFPISVQRHLFAASVLLFPILLIVVGLSWAALMSQGASQTRGRWRTRPTFADESLPGNA